MIRMKRAFDRYPTDWSMTALATSPTYIKYPEDVSIPPSRKESRELMERLWAEAEVVHVHRHLLWFADFDKRNPRPIVFNNHGTAFRAESRQILREARHVGAIVVVSTIDLLNFDKDLVWLPAPYQIDQLQSLRKRDKPPATNGRAIRIVHAPTDRRIKSTAEVIAAVDRLSRKYPIEFDLIENVPWLECLKRKARADIVVDQLTLGYGCNAIEAWGMGIPVIAGTTDPATRERMVAMLGELPFYEATEANLVQRIEELIADKELRDEWGRRGLAYAREYHDDLKIMRQAEDLYEQSITSRKPNQITRLSAGEAPRNRLVSIRDSNGQVRLMTPARAELHGYEILKVTA